jgi:hypothetical protein
VALTRDSQAVPVPVVPHRPPALHGRFFRGSAVVAAGLLTRRQLRSSAWQHVFRDVYACSTVEPTHSLLAVAAAGLLLPGAVVSGRSAATLWGLPAAGTGDPVELTVPAGAAPCAVPGVRVRRRALSPVDVTLRRGTRVTTAVATAVDLGRALPLDEAVASIDHLVRAGLTDLAAIRAAAALVTGRGCRRARAAAARADGLAESPQETRLRLVLHASPLPRPVAQHTVRDADGRFVARVDFGWPGHRLAVEYEGAWHGEPQNVARDRARLNRLTAVGWRVVFVTAADLRHPDRLVARIAAALGA